ncbi:hypothetical protein T11_10737 [Trichinella zimbabwensis]|uniref:Uncharacterized protein n=1 Tax=Trichinella zimbabwensis TaxID=268475 RepID=A0A0V1HAX3_9BILA|nr:hypothetical protein T11_10737 [Trichinella zimbabwensis]
MWLSRFSKENNKISMFRCDQLDGEKEAEISCDRDWPADYIATLTWKCENRSLHIVQLCNFLSQLPGTVKVAFQHGANVRHQSRQRRDKNCAMENAAAATAAAAAAAAAADDDDKVLNKHAPTPTKD